MIVSNKGPSFSIQAFLKFMAETGEDDNLSDDDDDDADDGKTAPDAVSALPAVVPKKPKYSVKSYDCCICNQSEPSTAESPMALVAFQQPTRVLGARIREGHPQETLPFAAGLWRLD